MKLRLLVTILTLCISVFSKAAQDHTNAFITVWDTSKMDASTSLTIPSTGSSYQYYWEKVGDESNTNSGSYQTIASGNLSIPAITAQSGIYKVYIKGSYTRITMSSNANSAKALTEIESWGNMAWANMGSAFRGCANLTKLPVAAPNLSNVTDMSNMFYQATNFNHNISNWNVGNVTNMAQMFREATNFNQNIGNWSVSNVANMRYMFFSAKNFNQDISDWNVGKVTDMTWMFAGANKFNQNISNWDVSKVTDMSTMFSSATAFNQNLGTWQLDANVNLTSMLPYSGLNAENFSLTLKGWAENPNTPTGRTLGATSLKYNADAQQYKDILTTSKGWTITDGGVVLPVTIVSFTAKTQENSVKITWQTASESNNSHFIIERSVDGINFQYLTKAEAKGAGIYEVYDRQPTYGSNYYRLTQFDKDGTTENHGIQAINFSVAAATVKLYPNPTDNEVNIVFGLGNYHTAMLTDLSGRVLQQVQINPDESSKALSLGNYASGTYLIKLTGSKGTELRKVVKR